MRCRWFDCTEKWTSRKPSRWQPSPMQDATTRKQARERSCAASAQTRAVTWTGCLAASAGRRTCGTPAPGFFGRPAPGRYPPRPRYRRSNPSCLAFRRVIDFSIIRTPDIRSGRMIPCILGALDGLGTLSMMVVMAAALLLPAFVTFDRLVKREHDLFADAWEADGRPHGIFWRPEILFRPSLRLFRSGLATNRCML